MQLNSKRSGIKITQVLKSNGIPAYVEWFSYADSRNHIIKAETFCEQFGYTLEDLNQQSTMRSAFTATKDKS